MNIDKRALLVSKAKASVFTMGYISQFEASDIDSDDIDLRFEVDGVETGTTVSIVDECGHAAQIITALLDELESKQTFQQAFFRQSLMYDVVAEAYTFPQSGKNLSLPPAQKFKLTSGCSRSYMENLYEYFVFTYG
ncbi:hypothetical protein LD928_20070 [Salmonella enterica]|nr:hypothetical protein [Salmonella enterica]